MFRQHAAAMLVQPTAIEGSRGRIALVLAAQSAFAILSDLIIGAPPAFLTTIAFGSALGLALELQARRAAVIDPTGFVSTGGPAAAAGRSYPSRSDRTARGPVMTDHDATQGAAPDDEQDTEGNLFKWELVDDAKGGKRLRQGWDPASPAPGTPQPRTGEGKKAPKR